MRLWSLHPKYLDAQGLVALWREALLAQSVLNRETRGYRNHPQLDRFKDCASPVAALSLYLEAIHDDAKARGYAFDISKIKPTTLQVSLTVTSGQMAYEWAQLMGKLKKRNPAIYQQWQAIAVPDIHPLFTIQAGEVESWERM